MNKPSRESLRIALEIVEKMKVYRYQIHHHKCDADAAQHLIATALDEMKPKPVERCKHDVHGTDCYECYPSDMLQNPQEINTSQKHVTLNAHERSFLRVSIERDKALKLAENLAEVMQGLADMGNIAAQGALAAYEAARANRIALETEP
jgi:hypothetical protein